MKLKYRFKRSVSKDLTIFSKKLKKKGYVDSTIRQNRNYAGIYLSWLNKEKIEQEKVDYKNIIRFIQYLKHKEHNSIFINRVLLSIRHYYEYRELKINPAYGINLRGARFKISDGFIQINELIKLYKNYQIDSDKNIRNRVILGILIFQGLTADELGKLELKHIDLREAKFYIPGGKKTNSRILDINAIQLIDLYDYINITRPRMLLEIEKLLSGRRPFLIHREIIERQLFFSKNGSEKLKSTLHHLFRKVIKTNPQINSTRKIRNSVITNWLKNIGIRQVQYMAGHKYVRSTLQYIDLDMTELTKEVKVYHPLD